VNQLQGRAFTDLKRELEAPRLSALRSTLGLAVASAALRHFGDGATAAESRQRPAQDPGPSGMDVRAVRSGTVGQGRPADVVEKSGVPVLPRE
jgi:hypothetical protein